MNIHELDRDLVPGDAKQIAVIQALEAGMKPCRVCGEIIEPDEDGAGHGLCEECHVLWSCPDCGHYMGEPTDGPCKYCKEADGCKA